MRTQIKRIIILFLPIIIGIFLIFTGIWGILSSDNTLDQLVITFILFPGIFLILHTLKELKDLRTKAYVIKYDERSAINLLRAADISFRFFFLTLSLLILFHAIGLINQLVLVSILGPVVAGGVMCYYLSYYWFEKKG